MATILLLLLALFFRSLVVRVLKYRLRQGLTRRNEYWWLIFFRYFHHLEDELDFQFFFFRILYLLLDITVWLDFSPHAWFPTDITIID